MVYRYKIEARREVMEEMRAEQKQEKARSINKKTVTQADIKRFEANTKAALRKEIIKLFYQKRPATEEEDKNISKHIDRIYNYYYVSEDSPVYISPSKVILAYYMQGCRLRQRKQATESKQINS